jgi:hypothetical protein
LIQSDSPTKKKDFEAIVDKAIKEDEDGEIRSDTLKAAYDLVKVVRAKLAAQPLEGAKARDEASRFVKTLAGLVRLLERPDTTDAFNREGARKPMRTCQRS